MSAETRGHAIKERRLRLGIKSVRELARQSGVDRGAVTAAEAGTASIDTYDLLEAWLDAFEEETGSDVPERGVVTWRVTGNFGVAVALSGPVENLAELEASIERLVRSMGPGASAVEIDADSPE